MNMLPWVDFGFPFGRRLVLSLLFFSFALAGCRSLEEPNTLALPPDDAARAKAMALFSEAVLLNAAQDVPEAEKKPRVERLMEEAYRADPDQLDIAVAYGRSLDERKLPEAALAVYERCLLGNPGVADLHRLAFAAAFAANRIDRMPIHAAAVFEADSADRKKTAFVIDSLISAGLDADALALARRDHERHQDAEIPRKLCMWSLALLAELERGEKNRLHPGEPLDPHVIARRVRTFLQTARTMNGAERTGENRQMESDLAFLEVACYLAEDDWCHACATLERNTADHPDQFTGFALVGHYFSTNETAWAAFRSDHPLHGGSFTDCLIHGYQAEEKGRVHDSRIAFQTAYNMLAGAGETVPPSLFAAYVQALEQDGCWDEAFRIMRWGIACHPDSAILKNLLAYSLALEGRELALAERLVDEALQAEPESIAYLDTKGWILFKANRPYEAIQFLLRAVAIKRDPEVCDHLRDALRTVGRDAEARMIKGDPVENPAD